MKIASAADLIPLIGTKRMQLIKLCFANKNKKPCKCCNFENHKQKSQSVEQSGLLHLKEGWPQFETMELVGLDWSTLQHHQPVSSWTACPVHAFLCQVSVKPIKHTRFCMIATRLVLCGCLSVQVMRHIHSLKGWTIRFFVRKQLEFNGLHK